MALHIGPLLGLWLLVVLLVKGSFAQLQVCGTAPRNSRMVKGQSADPGSWPWQASIYNSSLQPSFCGGSLVNREWVLAPAQCYPSFVNPKDVTVILGRHNKSTTDPNEVNRTVTQIIRHPDFNKQGMSDMNIALLKLSSPVTFGEYIRPVCLAAENSTFHDGTKSWLTGWKSNATSGALEEVEVKVVGNNRCKCSRKITDNMMCTGLPTKDNCKVQAGSPLVHRMIRNGTTRWVQSGFRVVMGRSDDCDKDRPEVYTRVSLFQNWIDSHIKTDRPGYVTFTSNGTDPDEGYACPTPSPMTTKPPMTSPNLTKPPMTKPPMTKPPMTTHPHPPPPPVKPCESLFCGGPNTVHFSYFTHVLTVALMLYSMAGFA